MRMGLSVLTTSMIKLNADSLDVRHFSWRTRVKDSLEHEFNFGSPYAAIGQVKSTSLTYYNQRKCQRTARLTELNADFWSRKNSWPCEKCIHVLLSVEKRFEFWNAPCLWDYSLIFSSHLVHVVDSSSSKNARVADGGHRSTRVCDNSSLVGSVIIDSSNGL